MLQIEKYPIQGQIIATVSIDKRNMLTHSLEFKHKQCEKNNKKYNPAINKSISILLQLPQL